MSHLRKAENAQKWSRFGALTFIGMLATHAFTIGVGAQRTMWTRPGHPLYPDFTWWLFNWAGEVNWVAVILFMSIPLLAVVVDAEAGGCQQLAQSPS